MAACVVVAAAAAAELYWLTFATIVRCTSVPDEPSMAIVPADELSMADVDDDVGWDDGILRLRTTCTTVPTTGEVVVVFVVMVVMAGDRCTVRTIVGL